GQLATLRSGGTRGAAAPGSTKRAAALRAAVGRRLRLALRASVEVDDAGERRILRARPEPGRGVDDARVGREQAADEPGLAARRAGGTAPPLALAVPRHGAVVDELLPHVRHAAHVTPVIVRGVAGRTLRDDRRLGGAARRLAVLLRLRLHDTTHEHDGSSRYESLHVSPL